MESAKPSQTLKEKSRTVVSTMIRYIDWGTNEKHSINCLSRKVAAKTSGTLLPQSLAT